MQTWHLPSFFEFKMLLKSATYSFIFKSLKTFDNNIRLNSLEETKDQIADVRATTNPDMQASHELNKSESDTDSEFALKHCYLVNATTTTHNSGTDSTHTYLRNVAKTIGVNVEKDKEEYDMAKSFRSQYPINEFTEGKYGLVAAFPHIFMFGRAYKKNTSN